MGSETHFEHYLQLQVGVVAQGDRCLPVIRILAAFKTSRLRFKLLGLASTSQSTACNKFAGEMGTQLFDDYRQLLTLKTLDLILELTGDEDILTDLIRRKPPSIGVLDRQAALLLLDIADQHEMAAKPDAEIGLSSSFASTLLDTSPDGVMVIDRNYRIINHNNSPLVKGEQGRLSVLGRHCFEVFHGSLNPCTGEHRACPARETLRTRRPARAVHETTNSDGELRICQVTAYPLFNQLGEIIQFVETYRDITPDLSERIEQRTQAIKDDLSRVIQEERLASLGRLVASVCHEINNPIASIVTFNKLILAYIREDRLPPEGLAAFCRYLDLSVKEALRCGEIVKNLLAFARQKSIDPQKVDLSAIVKTVLILTSHQLKMARVDHQVDLPEAPFTAWGDQALIQQCLMNLVFNAKESMPDGGRVDISGGRNLDAGTVWLNVADTGHGIAAEELPRIFEPFYSTKDVGKGTGLGLSVAYGIIRENNGTIEVKSELGQGTEFKMILPAEPSNAAV